MYSISDNIILNPSKLYTIQYHHKNYQNVHNAIFGRASKPYPFRFLKINTKGYVLARNTDDLILCIDEGELCMSISFGKCAPLIIQPIKVKKRTFVLSVQNQSNQQYIDYDAYVLHEYYVGLKTMNSVEDAAIWAIHEVENESLPIIKNNYFSLN